LQLEFLVETAGNEGLAPGLPVANAVVSLARSFAVLLPTRRVFRNNGEPEGYNQMRLKLVLISALIAAVVGAGSAIAIILSVLSSLKPGTAAGLLVVSTYLLPTLATLLASIFVYRHTARRRRLQAVLTAIIALVLTIFLFVLASIITARTQPVQPQPGPQQNIS
jgi:small-conductance mechanosensitive channel